MMNKAIYRLSSGREIFLVRWIIVGTYSGFLEGSQETASRHIIKNISEQADRLLPPARPLAVVLPKKTEVLPQWMCVAELESHEAVHHKDGDYFSRLQVCWFMDDTARSLDSMIESVLPHLDWDQVAEDYDFTDW